MGKGRRMLDRRAFLWVSGMTGAASLGASDAAAAADGPGRQYYELCTYHLDSDAQRDGLCAFFEQAAIPAWNRLGLEPVGVFLTPDEPGPVYVLLPHPSAESVVTAKHRLLDDAAYLADGAAFLDATPDAPAYARIESSLLLALTGMPRLETPAKAADRVVQLRTYESPSVKTGLKKIEMFNQGELAIFRRVGLNPVFFGEALLGAKLQNLTYMLAFDSMDAQKAAWNRFRKDPEWQELSAKPEYANDAILCGITNLNLVPARCSQI